MLSHLSFLTVHVSVSNVLTVGRWHWSEWYSISQSLTDSGLSMFLTEEEEQRSGLHRWQPTSAGEKCCKVLLKNVKCESMFFVFFINTVTVFSRWSTSISQVWMDSMCCGLSVLQYVKVLNMPERPELLVAITFFLPWNKRLNQILQRRHLLFYLVGFS